MTTKQEIVDKLKELNIEHDASASKAELEALLPEGIVFETEEDAPHKALRAIIAAYAQQNPVKFASKKAEFDKRLAGKLAFALGPDGTVLDGHLDENGKAVPTQVVVAN